MDYETSPTMQFEGASDAISEGEAAQNEEKVRDGSTGSEGSEGFVKVEDVLEEPEEKKSVEEKPLVEVPSVQLIDSEPSQISVGSDSAMLDCLDPRGNEFSTQKTLQDYYDQLPTETAPFASNDFNSKVADDDVPRTKLDVDYPDDKMELTMESAPTAEIHVNSPSLNLSDDKDIEVSDKTENSDSVFPQAPMDISEAETSQILTPPADDFPIVLDDDAPILQEDNYPLVKEEILVEQKPADTPKEVEAAKTEVKQEENPTDASYEDKDSQDPVVDLLYWRDIKVSAVVFGLTLLVLVSLRCFSIISVVSYLGLSLLTVTITFRVAKLVMQTVNGTQQPNPFQALLDTDVTLSNEQVQKYVDSIVSHINCTLVCTRDLVLVKNTVASLKFGTLLWLATYIGCCFNGLTLLTIGVVFAFALPPLYEKYQGPIDKHYEIVKNKACEISTLIRSKIPGAKPKSE